MKCALGKSIFTALSKAIPRGKRRLDTESAVFQSQFLGRGCDEAIFSEKKGFSVKRGQAIQ